MNQHPNIDDALRALREEPVTSVDDADRAALRRERVVGYLALVIEREARAANGRSRRGLGVGLFALVAAAAAAVFLFTRAPTDTKAKQHEVAGGGGSTNAASAALPAATIVGWEAGASVFAASAVGVATVGGSLQAGSSVATSHDAHASLITATNVEIAIGPDSEVVITGGNVAAEKIELRAGRIEVHVPSGDRARTFLVSAPLATVVVHGTRFAVATSGVGLAAKTQVEVSEGTVTVQHARGETLLRDGGRWESWSAPQPTTSASSATALPKPAAAGSGASASPPSALAEQNRLYQDAMASKRALNDQAMIEKLDSLLARWPSSPLAEEARAERARARARLGNEP